MSSIIELGIQSNIFGYITISDVHHMLYYINCKLFLLNSANYGDWAINEIMRSIGEFTQKMGYDWSHINQYQQINMYKIHLLMQKKSTFESWVYYASNGFRK